MKPNVVILHVPGTNRDREAAWACELAGGVPRIAYLTQVDDGRAMLDDAHMLVLPGGFSFGDDLGAGRIWASALRHRFGDALRQFIADGGPVIGICNGFQALLKSGLLDEHQAAEPRATLTRNASARFECRWVHLAPQPDSPCVFTAGLTEPIECPAAHGEGRFVVRDDDALRAIEDNHWVALRYVTPDGQRPAPYPHNPNGSVADIAGICNPAGNVLGLMPHPEDHIRPQQHPDFQRRRGSSLQTRGLGLRLIEQGIRYAAER